MMDGIDGYPISEGVSDFRTDSVDDAWQFISKHVSLERLTPLGGEFRFHRRVLAAAPINLSEASFGADVEHKFVQDKYRVSVALNGAVEFLFRGVDGVSARSNAAVTGPGDPVTIKRWPRNTRVLSVGLDTGVVESALAGMIGTPVNEPIRFSPSMPMGVGHAGSWVNLVRDIGRAASLLSNPIVAAPFVDGLARGLLVAAHHPYREQVERSASLPRSAVVRAAVEYIDDHAGRPLTVSEIAAQCHTTTRNLQYAFKRHMGISPMAYARRVRLRRLHDELRSSDPGTTTVLSVAHKWGFLNLGRLAREYRLMYGRSPLETLQRAN